jgi:hypothetical protein
MLSECSSEPSVDFIANVDSTHSEGFNSLLYLHFKIDFECHFTPSTKRFDTKSLSHLPGTGMHKVTPRGM